MIKRTTKKWERILVAHCEILNENLERDLIRFLKQSNTSFIVLLERIGFQINSFSENSEKKLTLPLTLSGSITKLSVRDAKKQTIKLSLGKNFISIEETEGDSVGTYLISSEDYKLEQLNVLYTNGSSFSIFDSFIVLESKESSVTIILNEDQDCSPSFKTIAKLCVDSLNTKDLQVEEILNFLKNNNFFDFTIIRKNSIPA